MTIVTGVRCGTGSPKRPEAQISETPRRRERNSIGKEDREAGEAIRVAAQEGMGACDKSIYSNIISE